MVTFLRMLCVQTPRFNLMGDTHDLRHAVRHIVERVRRERPGSPIFLAGISAGSGLLVRYLGEEGPESPFMAAASLCPGYDIRVCFRHVHPLCELCGGAHYVYQCRHSVSAICWCTRESHRHWPCSQMTGRCCKGSRSSSC